MQKSKQIVYDECELIIMSVISNLLQKLGTTNDVEGVLQELKVTLYAIPLSQLQDAIRNVSFEPVFACFNSTRR